MGARIEELQSLVADLTRAAAAQANQPPPAAANAATTDEEESKSEEEPSPPPKKRSKKRSKKKPAPAPANSNEFVVDQAYKPGMAWNKDWSRQKKAAYKIARREFHSKGTKAAQKDRVAMFKALYKSAKERGNLEAYKRLKAKYTKEKEKLTEME